MKVGAPFFIWAQIKHKENQTNFAAGMPPEKEGISMSGLRDQLRAEKDYLVGLRRDFHRNPELALQEKCTTRTLSQEMRLQVRAWIEQVAEQTAYLSGTANAGLPGTLNSLHNSNFDLDEDALVLSAGLYAEYALWWLGKGEKA